MKKIISVSFIVLLTMALGVWTFQYCFIAKTAKGIFESSYESYGKEIPDEYEEMVSSYYFELMNHRVNNDKIVREENNFHISTVKKGLKNAEVRLFYEYHTFDSEGNYYIGTTGEIPVKIRFSKNNGKWVVCGYVEDP